MTTLSPIKTAFKTHLHVYLHASVQPGDEVPLQDQAREMLAADIGLSVVGQLGSRSDYVPMSFNIPLIASTSINEALEILIADTSDRTAKADLQLAVQLYILSATATKLRITIQHFIPGTGATKTEDHTLSSTAKV